MKKGFTMIELIFVIVILGILASVAIPRLAGTKEDAEISATIGNLRTLLSDASSYFVTKGDFKGAKWRDFTNVPLKDKNGDTITSAANAVGGQTFLAVGGKNCLQVGIMDTDTSTFVQFMPVAANKNDLLCAAVLASTPVKQLLDSGIVTGDADLNMCTGVSNGGMSCLNITPNRIY